MDMMLRKRNARGNDNGNAKLSATDVEQLRQRAAAGESLPKLADEMGVAHSTVWAAVTGRTWNLDAEFPS